MAIKLTRREFIVSLLAAGITFSVGGFWFFKDRQNPTADTIVAILRSRLSFLSLDEAGLEAFAMDHQDRILNSDGAIHCCDEDLTVSYYLLSSSFFENGADESQTVEYLGYYDPLTRVCQNPFAQL
jgi:hypothetical protein